jgi:hypothetical protein
LVEGLLDRLRHSTNHPQREVAIDAPQNPAAQDDIGTARLAEPRERCRRGVAPAHEAIEIIDQRIVAVAAQVTQHRRVSNLDTRR